MEVIGDYYAELRSQADTNALPITVRTLETIIRLSTAAAKARLSTGAPACYAKALSSTRTPGSDTPYCHHHLGQGQLLGFCCRSSLHLQADSERLMHVVIATNNAPWGTSDPECSRDRHHTGGLEHPACHCHWPELKNYL